MTANPNPNTSTPSDRMRVAAVQMISTPQVAENLSAAERLIAAAVYAGAHLVVLPEYFCHMGLRDADKITIREAPGTGPIQEFLRDTARRHGIWLVGGSLPLVSHEPGKVLNTTLVFDPEGQVVARYDKIHLFSFRKVNASGTEAYDESVTITAGREPAVFDAPFGRVGLSICYDLRFPELYRKLGDTVLMLVPSAFTATTGKAHWEILLRARAIENQCYVLAAAQGGKHPNQRTTHGHSMLIDPWGEVQAVLPEGEGFISGELDTAHLAAIRLSLPALGHRVL